MLAWYLVAVVMYNWSPDYDYKIYKAEKFMSLEECKQYYETYENNLEESLKRVFPNIESLSIECIDSMTILKMQQKINEENNEFNKTNT